MAGVLAIEEHLELQIILTERTPLLHPIPLASVLEVFDQELAILSTELVDNASKVVFSSISIIAPYSRLAKLLNPILVIFGRGEGTGEVRASFAATGRQWCTREPGTRKFSGSELA